MVLTISGLLAMAVLVLGWLAFACWSVGTDRRDRGERPKYGQLDLIRLGRILKWVTIALAAPVVLVSAMTLIGVIWKLVPWLFPVLGVLWLAAEGLLRLCRTDSPNNDLRETQRWPKRHRPS